MGGRWLGGMALSVLACAAVSFPAASQETLRVAVAQRGNWDSSVAELGQRAGIFRKHGLDLDIAYPQSATEAARAVLTGTAEIGVGLGLVYVIAAHAKGAPLRIVGAQATGAADLYWYVKDDSPIRSLKDAAGRTLAYSAEGSLTQAAVAALMAQHGVKAKPVATGGPPGTYTQVITGEVDIGWAAPPFGFDQIERKGIRVVASGREIAALRQQTARVLVTGASVLESRRSAIERFLAAYRETVDWMYGEAAIRHYAQWQQMPEERARRMREQYFPKDAVVPDTVSGVDRIVADALARKMLAAAPTPQQLAELMQIPRRQ